MRTIFMKSLMFPLRVIDKWWSNWESAYSEVMKEIKKESEDSRGNS